MEIIDYIDNLNISPLILVDTSLQGLSIPEKYIDRESNTIVLNISKKSIRNFKIDNNSLFFSASFSGKNFDITIPCISICQIFTREYGLIAEIKDNVIVFNDVKVQNNDENRIKKNTFLKVIK